MPDYSKEIWEFKYAPKKMTDLILPDKYIKLFNRWIQKGNVDNSLFVSNKPGSGKTSITRILASSKVFATIFVNASVETSIDNVRHNIRNFVSTASPFKKAPKLVFLDEADRMTSNALDALKGEIENSISNARFIFTANRESAFPEPIMSRLKIFNFDHIFSEHKKELYNKAFVRLSYIFNEEGIKFDQKALALLIQKFAPDWRNLIKTCQLMSSYSNEITMDDVKKADITNEIKESLLGWFKEKNFKSIREFSVKNIGNEHTVINELYKLTKTTEFIEPESIPEMIIILADANRNINTVPDQEIEMMHMFIQIMTEVNFK